MSKNAKLNTPVLLLSGYLGSGKTTLVNHILTNKKGIKFAVIVNDIGEVNIDADLIQKGGIVDKKDESLVALQNGCICCTLKAELMEQIAEILQLDRFDYIVIEASGICEPEPIARTIVNMPRMEEYSHWGVPRLDCIATVVDALRMKCEFENGNKLLGSIPNEEDIENLIIQQVEFCNLVLLNKADEVSRDDLDKLRKIITTLNPGAKIIECNYANVSLDELLYTHLFNYQRIEDNIGWIKELERLTTPEEDEEAKHPHHHHEHEDEDEHEHHHDDEHEHHHHDHHDEHEHHHHDDEHGHHHHHHHDEGEAEEYGIGTFVYYRRQAFDIEKFDRYINLQWPNNVIRCKGICYFSQDLEMSYLFEQAGTQVKLQDAGKWYATMPAEELAFMLEKDAGLAHDWDDDYGDRMQKIVFIGQKMDKEQIIRALDDCLAE